MGVIIASVFERVPPVKPVKLLATTVESDQFRAKGSAQNDQLFSEWDRFDSSGDNQPCNDLP